jgi:hypothetical protein
MGQSACQANWSCPLTSVPVNTRTPLTVLENAPLGCSTKGGTKV